MKNQIIEIIEYAKKLKANKISDLEIAKYVHIELGRLIIYNNDYTVRNVGFDVDQQTEGTISENSINRQRRILNSKTDIKSNEQVCKSMAEIYSSILSEIGISSKVVAVRSKEEVDGEKREDGTIITVPQIYKCSFDSNMMINTEKNERETVESPSHWYCLIQTEKGEYIQDYLTEMALARIKIGETSIQERQLAGFHPKEEHRARTQLSNMSINESFKKKLCEEYKSYCESNKNPNRAFDFVFKKLGDYILYFGFEEAKDAIIFIGQCLPKGEIIKKPEVINLVKEDEKHCKVICIYRYNGKNYLVRSGMKDSEIPIGEITTGNVKEVLKQGYEPRKLSDAKKIRDMKITEKISMKSVIANAINKGISMEQVQKVDNVESIKIQGQQMEGVTKDG